MKRPAVVWGYEIPMLKGLAVRQGIVLDVGDGSADFIGVVEEDFPAAAVWFDLNRHVGH